MTFTKEQIYNFVYNNLHELSNDSIMEINEDELGNEHVGKMYDFDDYVRGESFLDVYNSLASNFSAHDDFFKYDGEYSTSDDLSDFINMDEIAEWITDEFTSDSADDYLDEGDCYGLHAIYIPLKEKMNAEEKPKHTEDEIRTKLQEMVMDLPDSMVIHMASYKMDKFEIPFYEMSLFAEVCDSMNYGIPKVIGMLANSIGWLEFKDPYFTINGDNQFQSYSICSLKNEIWQGLCDNEYEEEWLKDKGYGDFAKVRNGYWEE